MSNLKLAGLSLVAGIALALYLFWWPLVPLTKLPLNLGYLASVQTNLADYEKVLSTLQDMSDNDLILVATAPQPCGKLIDCRGLYYSQVKTLAAKQAEARAEKIEREFKKKDQQNKEKELQIKEQELLLSAQSANAAWWSAFWKGVGTCVLAAPLIFTIFKFGWRLMNRKSQAEHVDGGEKVKKPAVAPANEQKTAETSSETVPPEAPSPKQGPPPLG